MVTGSGPSLRTESTMPSGPSCARSIASRSTGGTFPPRRRSPGLVLMMSATSIPSSTSGTIPASHSRERDHLISGVTAHPHGFEHAHPSELGEFTLVGVEHELPGIPEPGFENRPLALTEHDRVGRLRRG